MEFNSHKPYEFYKNCSEAFFLSLTDLYPQKSKERAVLLGMTKIIDAFYYMCCKDSGVKIKLMDPNLFIKQKFRSDIKGYVKNIMYPSNTKTAESDILLLGHPTSEAFLYAEKHKKPFVQYRYPGKLFCRSSLLDSKKSKYHEFFSYLVEKLEPQYIKNLNNLVNFANKAAFLAVQLEPYAIRCSNEILKMKCDVLVTNSGNWKNRIVASLCTYRGVQTIGLPHGNIFLTGFDEDQHIEGDVLPICSTVMAYNEDHLEDWAKLCETNTRIKMLPKFELLDESNEYAAARFPIKSYRIKVLISGHVYNDNHHVFLKNYTTDSARTLEQRIINDLYNNPKISQIDYKPHPDNKLPTNFMYCNLLKPDKRLEDIIQDYDLVVFPHVKSSTFGYCLKHHERLLVFLDRDISLSKRSERKLRDICHTIDLNFDGENLIYDEATLKNVVG